MRKQLRRLESWMKKKAETSMNKRMVSVCEQLLREVAMEAEEHRIMKRFLGIRNSSSNAGSVGRLVLLLYCGKLFELSELEQEKCVNGSDGAVAAEELQLLITSASELRSGQISVLEDKRVLDILSRVCSSPYFVQEDVETVSRLVQVTARLALEPRFPALVQRKVKEMYKSSGFVHYLPKHSRDAQDIKACLQHEVTGSGALADLLTVLARAPALDKLLSQRPPQSLLPHIEAARVCIEHASLWLSVPYVRVFHPLGMSYMDISGELASTEDWSSFMNHWDVRLPSSVERALRCSLLQLLQEEQLSPGAADVYELRPEDYEFPKAIMRFLEERLSPNQIRVLQSLQFHYRAPLEELQLHKVATCLSAAKLVERHIC